MVYSGHMCKNNNLYACAKGVMFNVHNLLHVSCATCNTHLISNLEFVYMIPCVKIVT